MPQGQLINGKSDGWMVYSNSASTVAYTTGTPLKLLNNGLGPQTLKTYKPKGLTELWNTSTNQFNLSELILGDEVVIRFSFDLETLSNNTESYIYTNMAIGGAAYSLYNGVWTFKTIGTRQIGSEIMIYIGNNDTIIYPTELLFVSDANCNIKVNSFYISVKRKSYFE